MAIPDVKLSDLLGPSGPLAQHLPGFAPRLQQQQMAAAVATALRNRQVLIAEAGTGTGKTFAYLVPALLLGRRVVISTGTRNLQDQLYHKDLPLVRRALERPVKVALLKGRSNYLCLQRLQQAEIDSRWPTLEQVAMFNRIRAWAGHTRTGDTAEVGDVPEDSPVWPRVTSTTDNCLGQNCPLLNDCYLVKARRQALNADVVVINHHLLFADLVLKEAGVGELLPGADAFILDEAHQLPDVASLFFGLSLSSHQLAELSRDIQMEQLREAKDFPVLAERARALDKAVADMRLALGADSRRAPWAAVAQAPAVVEAVADLRRVLDQLLKATAEAAGRGKALENCHRRAQELSARWQQLTTPAADDRIHWFETRPRGFSLTLTPLEVAGDFRGCLQRYPGTWIFTSATLAVGNDFSHFADRLGLTQSLTLRLDSPFDFQQQALLYQPPGLPDPGTPSYNAALLQAVTPVLAASRGRAFLLFTSYKALREAAAALEGRLPYPLLVQGSLPRNALLEQFRALGNAILLGTASFWEGVDVRGEALSCVVIDKLPFAAPTDPVLQGRINAMREQGIDAFMQLQLPQAVITLKQGAGRLIRDATDRGVLVLCDPRLLSKSYGRVFMASLPPMARTRDLAQVQRFFAAGDGEAA